MLDSEKMGKLAPSDLLESIADIWETERQKSQPDFDDLFKAGLLSKRLAAPHIQSRLKEWLRNHDPYDKNIWGVAGCFLMGYWQPEDMADEELVEMLLQALEGQSLGQDPRDAIISAISHCHSVLKNVDLLRRIESCFYSLWNQRKRNAYQPYVAKALAKVLKVK
jgi:hypothetical protein